MVAINDIIDEINRIILSKYEDFVFYVDFAPKEFKRPSMLIELAAVAAQERVSFEVVRRKIYFTVTYFAPTNEYYRPDRLGLHDVLDGVMGLFRSGNIRVCDRSLDIFATSGGENEKEIYMDLQMEFMDDVTDESPQYDIAESVTIKIE